MDDKKYLESLIRDIPDWPKEGILFRDITPILADVNAFKQAVKAVCGNFTNAQIDFIAGIEARGFIFAAAAAVELQVGFVPIRKAGKLPFKTERVDYALEYGQASLEIHADAFKPGASILVMDDLLATGGTMAAACELIEKVGGKVAGINFLIELADLGGRAKLSGYEVNSVLKL